MVDLTISSPAFYPEGLDTGVIVSVMQRSEDLFAGIHLDYAALIKEVGLKDLQRMPWKRSYELKGFLIKIKAYKGPFGGRHFKYQAHKIRPDGSIGGRREKIHRINGKHSNFPW